MLPSPPRAMCAWQSFIYLVAGLNTSLRETIPSPWNASVNDHLYQHHNILCSVQVMFKAQPAFKATLSFAHAVQSTGLLDFFSTQQHTLIFRWHLCSISSQEKQTCVHFKAEISILYSQKSCHFYPFDLQLPWCCKQVS